MLMTILATQYTVPVTLLKVTVGRPVGFGTDDTAKSVPRIPATPRAVLTRYVEALEIFLTLPITVPLSRSSIVSESPAPKSSIVFKLMVVLAVTLTVEVCPLT